MKNSLFILLVLFSLLTGCISKTIPPVDIYTLSPVWKNNQNPTNRARVNAYILKLAQIRATQALSGTDILYTNSQYVLHSYAYSRWSDTPGKLMQTLIQAKLEESGLFKAVIPSTSISKADLLLESTLLDFSHHIKTDGTSEGVIRIRFYLINNTTRTVTASREFVSKVLATSTNAQGAVTALNNATRNVAHDLVDWLNKAKNLKEKAKN